jgi:hypothetical protein
MSNHLYRPCWTSYSHLHDVNMRRIKTYEALSYDKGEAPIAFFVKIRMQCMFVYEELNECVAWQPSHSCIARNDAASFFCVLCFHRSNLTRSNRMFVFFRVMKGNVVLFRVWCLFTVIGGPTYRDIPSCTSAYMRCHESSPHSGHQTVLLRIFELPDLHWVKGCRRMGMGCFRGRLRCRYQFSAAGHVIFQSSKFFRVH